MRFRLFTASWLSVLTYVIFAQPNGSLQVQYQINVSQTEETIMVDGDLNEETWQVAEKVQNFWYSFPTDDRHAEDHIRTEVQLSYNDEYIYLAARCYGEPPYIVQSLKRDARSMWRGDAFSVVFDPVNERTNGFVFATNSAGVQSESLVTGQTGTRGSENTSGMNSAWDNKWFVETKTFDDHWTVEMAIPFKSLRFGRKPVWGVNFIRSEMKTNSYHTWSPVPVQFRGVDLGYTGALIWEKPPKKTKNNISVIPYTLGGGYRDFEENIPLEFSGRVGGDAKVALTPSLNLDLTLNPDFSQVDVDEQVTNLNTFSVRFPERRLFFLENSDIFSDFGIPPIQPFFSRKIGLDEDGNTIPILFGARVSGNLNKNLRIGLMNMQTGEVDFPGNNYTSLAFHQRVFGRSIVKGYLHNRQAYVDGEAKGDDYNRLGGLEYEYRSVDGKWRGFGGLGLSKTNEWNTENFFYKLGGGYSGRTFSWYTNVSGVGNGYVADMGFIPRQTHYDAENDTSYQIGFHHEFTRLGYTIYPDNPKINSHRFELRNVFNMTTENEWFNNQISGGYSLGFSNSSNLGVMFEHTDFKLLYPFRFADEEYEPLPVGVYHFINFGAMYASDSRRTLSFTVAAGGGEFYNGTIVGFGGSANMRIQPWGNFSLKFERNKLSFPDPYGEGTLFLIGPKTEINFSRNLFWTTFIQYNTQQDNFNINSRLQWRYQPMSDLFIVYSDNYVIENWGPKNRGLVIKLNYWFNL